MAQAQPSQIEEIANLGPADIQIVKPEPLTLDEQGVLESATGRLFNKYRTEVFIAFEGALTDDPVHAHARAYNACMVQASRELGDNFAYLLPELQKTLKTAFINR